MRTRTVMTMIGVGVLILSVAIVVNTVEKRWFNSSNSRGQPTAKSDNPPKLASVEDQHWEAKALLREASLASQEALESVSVWNDEIEPLLSKAEGESIAANRDLVEKLAFVMQQPRVSESEIQIVAEQIKSMQERVDAAATATNPQLLSTQEMNTVRELSTNARTARKSWKKALEQAQAIVRQSLREVQPAATSNLRDSVDQVKDERVLANLDLEQKNPMTLGDNEFNSTVKTDVTSEAKKNALSPEVKSVLAPFLEPRDIQPRLSGAAVRFEKIFDKQPMSLGRLMSMGALDESVDGLKRLVAIGGNRKLPEPRWSINSMPGNWSDGDEEFLKKAQKMLREYGAILVTEGLLSD